MKQVPLPVVSAIIKEKEAKGDAQVEPNLVLLVDDEPQIREILRLYFEKEGFRTAEATDGAEALLMQQKLEPALIILDLMLPVLDGLEVCRQIRKTASVPIIMLTAREEDDDRILGLETGADDYVTKPFNPREVLARAKAVLRRVQEGSHAEPKDQVRIPGLVIDMAAYQVQVFDRKVELTARETELLHQLAAHPGRVFTREQLLELVWGYSYYGDTRTVDTHIKRIRHKLAIPADGPFDIKTVWGVGYKFEVEQ